MMTIQQLYRSKIKIGEEWKFLSVSFYERSGVVGPVSIGEESRIDYVRYFLTVNCKLSLTSTSYGNNIIIANTTTNTITNTNATTITTTNTITNTNTITTNTNTTITTNTDTNTTTNRRDFTW